MNNSRLRFQGPSAVATLALTLAATAATAATAAIGATASGAAPPAALKALEAQGLTVVGTFASPGGLTAWAAYSGQQPVALYAAPDGQHVIAGTMLDAQGNNVTRTALQQAVRAPMAAGAWKQLEASHWVADGKAGAPRTVYVFTDPNCPYCNKFWSDARPWVDSGKVQLRHVIVGILTPTSEGKAAALLSQKDPAAALAAYERSHVADTAKALAAGHPKPLAEGTVKPLATIPPALQEQLDANARLMQTLGLQATPAFAWRDAGGQMHTQTGAAPSMLATILGPR
jgi:thiol:disulfide interchange protein DsbG